MPSNAQWHAAQAYTVAQRQALPPAVTAADVAGARRQHLAAVQRVLAPSRLAAYGALRQQLTGTIRPLDGTELALV